MKSTEYKIQKIVYTQKGHGQTSGFALGTIKTEIGTIWATWRFDVDAGKCNLHSGDYMRTEREAYYSLSKRLANHNKEI